MNITVGLSGGVDSSVAALMLKHAGRDGGRSSDLRFPKSEDYNPTTLLNDL